MPGRWGEGLEKEEGLEIFFFISNGLSRVDI